MYRKTRGAAVSERQGSYMDLLLRGEALMQDIDDFIDTWHDAPDGSAVSEMSLAQYLGMTEDEYRLWVELPSSLRFIAAAHREKQPVEVLLASRDKLGLAARAGDRSEADRLVEWLSKRGRIPEPGQPWR
jgi:hypothetical protein